MNYSIDMFPDGSTKEVIKEAFKRGKNMVNNTWGALHFSDESVMILGLCDIIAELRKAKQ